MFLLKVYSIIFLIIFLMLPLPSQNFGKESILFPDVSSPEEASSAASSAEHFIHAYPLEIGIYAFFFLSLTVMLLTIIFTIKYRQKKELRYRAEHDILTGIFNKQTFFKRTEKLLRDNASINYLLLMCDIDRFKVINDQFGIDAGDMLLKMIAGIMKKKYSSIGTYGRIESDHFAACIPSANIDFELFPDSFSKEISSFPFPFEPVVKFGFYLIEDRTVDVSIMCDRASLAMRSIKGNYMKRYAVYDTVLRDTLLQEQQIINDMSHALENGEFDVYLQPQYNHAQSKLIGAEALVRWIHPVRGMIMPSIFIPIFEKNGFITKLDEFVWERVCQYLEHWLHAGKNIVPVSVNISRCDIYNPALPDIFESLIKKYALPVELLKLEITESAYVQNPEQLIVVVQKLRQKGFTVQMDDFGSGYSSLNTLKDVPVDMLKLDLNFLSGSGNSERGGNILNSIIRMAKWLSLPVLAEGVETICQADYLKTIGCDLVQGYLYGRPMTFFSFEKLLEESAADISSGKGRMKGLLDANSFWDPEAQSTLVFNSFVGGAGVFEMHNGNLEALRLNDKFFEEIRLDRDRFEKFRLHLFDIIYPDDYDDVISMFVRAAELGEEQESETRWAVPGGHISWLRIRVRMIAQNDDWFVYYAAVENITEKKELARKLSQSSEKLQIIMDQVSSGIVLFEFADRIKILFANPAFWQLNHYDKAEVFDDSFDIFSMVHPDDLPALMASIEKTIFNDTAFDEEFRTMRKGKGYFWVHMSASRIDFDQSTNPVYLALFTDISDFKK